MSAWPCLQVLVVKTIELVFETVFTAACAKLYDFWATEQGLNFFGDVSGFFFFFFFFSNFLSQCLFQFSFWSSTLLGVISFCRGATLEQCFELTVFPPL